MLITFFIFKLCYAHVAPILGQTTLVILTHFTHLGVCAEVKWQMTRKNVQQCEKTCYWLHPEGRQRQSWRHTRLWSKASAKDWSEGTAGQMGDRGNCWDLNCLGLFFNQLSFSWRHWYKLGGTNYSVLKPLFISWCIKYKVEYVT